MRLRSTFLTGAASYIQMGVMILTQLIAIPLALRFLDTERFGLWSFTSQSLGYLLLLDFGVSSSIGRMLVEPLHQGDERAWNGWFNMILAVLILQAALVLVLGLCLAEPILHWFNIPANLFVEAKQLWLIVLALNALSLPFRLLPGILGAQNRYYHYLFSTIAGALVGLAVFYGSLKMGLGSKSYACSLAAQMLVNTSLFVVAVARGPHRFRISMRGIPWSHARELFSFSSAVFLIGIAVQVAFMSQTLIITKILGLGAVASFTVCSRVPMQLMQLTWRPFDAFNSRWLIFWAKNEITSLLSEFSGMLRLTLGIALLVMTCSLAMNRWFVFIFGKQQLYLGKEFDFFFALFVIVQVWTHCVSFAFVMAKRMSMFAGVIIVDTAIGIVFTIFGTKLFGVNGFIAFTVLYASVSLGFWYITLKGPPIFGLNAAKLIRDSGVVLVPFAALLTISLLLFREVNAHCPEYLLVSEISVAVMALALFLGLFYNDLRTAIQRLQQARKNLQPQTCNS